MVRHLDEWGSHSQKPVDGVVRTHGPTPQATMRRAPGRPSRITVRTTPTSTFKPVVQALSQIGDGATVTAVLGGGVYERPSVAIKSKSVIVLCGAADDVVLRNFTLRSASSACVELRHVTLAGTCTITVGESSCVVLDGCKFAPTCTVKCSVADTASCSLQRCATVVTAGGGEAGAGVTDVDLCVLAGASCRVSHCDVHNMALRLVGSRSSAVVTHSTLSGCCVAVAPGATCDLAFTTLAAHDTPVLQLGGHAALKHCHLDAGEALPVQVVDDAASLEFGNVTTCGCTALLSCRSPAVETALPLFSGTVNFTIAGCGVGVNAGTSKDHSPAGLCVFRAGGKPVCRYSMGQV